MTDTLQRPAPVDRSVPAILAAAEIVIARFGHEKLSLAEIARVSLIPLARIYQYFADKNAVLGALSSRAFATLARSIDTSNAWNADLGVDARIDRIVDGIAVSLDSPSAAYLALCGPFDSTSTESRLEAVQRLGLALRNAVGADRTGDSPYRSSEGMDYAAELVFACFRRSYELDGRITPTAVEMAQHAVQSFVKGTETN